MEFKAPFALATFESEALAPFPGMIVGEHVHRLDRLLDGGSDRIARTMLDVFDNWEANWPRLMAAAPKLASSPGPEALRRDSLRVLAPLTPRQIVCAGANYRKHVIEIMVEQEGVSDARLSREERQVRAEKMMDHRAANGQPFAFLKPFSSLAGPLDDLVVPVDTHQLDWELELGVVIGKRARRVSRERALDHVAGYVIVNDISARDHVLRPDFPVIGMDWVSGKAGPGFLPLGPMIVPAAFIPDPQDLMITLKLNGEIMQHESTADMIFNIARLIEFLSVQMQLLPGDVICTGSPAGNGTHYRRFLRPGDVLEGTIAGLGAQRNRCVAEALTDGAVLHRPFAPLSN